jgi:hypothetical protein
MRERDRGQLRRLHEELGNGGQRAASADPVERLLDDLRRDPDLSKVQLTPNFLNDVGYVLERDGFGAAEAYLLDRADRRDLAPQARFMLNNVLPRLRACPPVTARRALGRYVIKVLPALQRKGEAS